MRIFKFGGSSLASPDAIKQVTDIIQEGQRTAQVHVVVSAFEHVTDELLRLSGMAVRQEVEAWRETLDSLTSRHQETIDSLLAGEHHEEAYFYLKETTDELDDILRGVTLVRELTPRTRDFIQSFGERLSAFIVKTVLAQQGVNASYLDARSFLVTDDRFSLARVDLEATREKLTSYLEDRSELQVITGFIGSTVQGETTTLGRGGSDYTAAIVGAVLHADEVVLWTDVDGVMTADPTKVRRAFPIESMTYEEAMEMSHFGAEVIYPPTMQPVLKESIPVRIKNTFHPERSGTLIGGAPPETSGPVTGLSSIDHVAVVRIQGTGMVGVMGTSARIFSALAAHDVNVILISQASSEHSLCLAVRPDDAEMSLRALRSEFGEELRRGMINLIGVEKNYTTLAVVGRDMRMTPGVAGKVFDTLGKNGINVVAIAQGSTELNISTIVDRENETKALTALHDAFFLSGSRTIHLFQIGVGNIGAELLRKIHHQESVLRDDCNVEIRLAGVADSDHMLFDPQGIPLDQWQEQLSEEGTPTDSAEFVRTMQSLNLPNSVFVDATADPDLPDWYQDILEESISIVTPNKKANARSMEFYRQLRQKALRHNAKFLYETNVGASLPIIETMRHMVIGGDRIQRIEAVLSGTLSYIFNVYDGSVPFSEVVRDAQKRGFTEPDPREDLNGMDVGRKLLILARESDFELEIDDIDIQSLVPTDARDAPSVDAFYEALEAHDDAFFQRYQEASRDNKRLCYVARFENGDAYTRLEAVGPNHPFYSIEAADNMVALTTDEYEARPLVIQGAGAGREVTAAGVLSDILKIARYGE